MTSRYHTVFILIAVIVGFFAVSHLFYLGMEQVQQWNDEAHQFSEAEALAMEPQFSLSDSTSSLFKTLFTNDPGHPAVDGPYLVLAGSFDTKSRAKKHLQRLKRLGFQEAEILYFKGKKEIYAIGVGAYREFSAAEQHVRTLAKRHQLEAYVHRIRKEPRT